MMRTHLCTSAMYFVTPTESTPIGIKQKSATQCIFGGLREIGLVL